VQKFKKARRGVFQGCHSFPLQTEETEPKKQNPSIKERSSTELRFASFLAPLCWVGGAVKGRDERRKAGALDSPSNPKGQVCFTFNLTRPMTS